MGSQPDRAPDLTRGAGTVVVGAGTAGAVVAARLAERGDDVLVLEAGPDHGPYERGGWPADLLDADALALSHDWGYRGPASAGRTLAFDRARVVGGCSAHNGCTQSWGWSGDYDRWAASGLPGWGAADLRPFFESASARMRATRPPDDAVQPLQRAFLDACPDLGVPITRDLDDLDGGVGVDVSPVNAPGGVRWNTAFAYLDPVRDRLRVVGDAWVRRVVVSIGRAVGVETVVDGHAVVVPAERVVVAAGAYGSPEVLLRSGIGPAPDLRGCGVDVVVDAPRVGAGLHDHPAVTLEYDASARLVALLDGHRARHGRLPEEQCVAKVATSSCVGPYDLHVYPWVERRSDSATGWVVVLPAGLLTPRSRGSVRLDPANPDGLGLVDHAFLADAEDVRALAEGVGWLTRLAASTALAPLLGAPRLVPDDDVDAWVRRTYSHYWHPAGSLAMGADDGAVVDAAGRVRGVDGLYVADASMAPEVPRSTPALPVVVFGERVVAGM